jgi:hypothetical protein
MGHGSADPFVLSSDFWRIEDNQSLAGLNLTEDSIIYAREYRSDAFLPSPARVPRQPERISQPPRREDRVPKNQNQFFPTPTMN